MRIQNALAHEPTTYYSHIGFTAAVVTNICKGKPHKGFLASVWDQKIVGCKQKILGACVLIFSKCIGGPCCDGWSSREHVVCEA